MKKFVIFILAIIVIGGGVTIARGVNNTAKKRVQEKQIQNFYSLPKLESDTTSIDTLVLGFKTAGMTIIEGANDSGKNHTKVATLPENIKFAFPLVGGSRLLYIADTDEGDVGSRIEVKDIKPGSTGGTDGKTYILYRAKDGFRIDRFVMSENNEWITWYEIKAPAGEDGYTHTRDTYRTFKAHITNPTSEFTWTKLSEQTPTDGTIVYLPSIITNDGQVYFDGIEVSSYGLYSGFLDESQNNTIIRRNEYNSRPSMFNQRYLVYTAYDKSQGSRVRAGESPSTREEVVNTNSIRMLDLSNPTLPPVTIASGANGEQYKHPIVVSGNPPNSMTIAVEVYGVEASGADRGKLKQKEIQLINYSLQGSTVSKVVDVPSSEKYRVLASAQRPNGNNTLIVGVENGTTGNLGTGWFIGVSGYQSMLSEVMTFDLVTMEKMASIKPESTGYFEFLGELNKPISSPIGMDRNESVLKLLPVLEDRGQQLQLETFIPVSPKRQRTNPRSDCVNEWQQKGYPNYEACEACPIYIYSDNVQDVRVEASTPLDEQTASPKITNGEWVFTADKLGTLISPDNSATNKIDFIFPRGKVNPPSYGELIEKVNFERGLKEYANKLGFVGREIDDFVAYVMPEIENSNYIMLSHLDQSSSKELLDFKVYPAPESRSSHMFYVKSFESKPDLKLSEPEFSINPRGKFAVVSWGVVFE